MKRSLAIVNYNMKVGGIQRSLLNFLREVEQDFEITLYLYSKEGDYLKEIPPSIQVKEISKNTKIYYSSIKGCKKLGFLAFLKKSYLMTLCKLFGSERVMPRRLNKIKINEKYDIAISFAHDISIKSTMWGANYIVNKMNASYKIAFVHSDPKESGYLTKFGIDLYKNFDKICCVSTYATKQFKELTKLDNVMTVHNLINIEEIITKSKEFNVDQYIKNSCINLITIARISPEKGIDRILYVANRLEKEDVPYNWIVLGEGYQLDLYLEQVKKDGLHNLHFLGEVNNPYPYLKGSDVLVIPSYFEVAPLVIDEAITLNKPILTTRYGYAEELVDEKFISDNDSEAFYYLVVDFIKNNKKEASFAGNFAEINELRKQEIKELLK